MARANDGTEVVAVIALVGVMTILAFPYLVGGLGLGYVVYRYSKKQQKSDERERSD